MESWRAVTKLAWRDLQLSRVRTAYLLAAMAVSVASISGVRSAANVARSALHRESRSWLGGDLAVMTGEPLDYGQIEELNRLRSRGIDWTAVTTALTMGASSESPDASVMAVKAVDPARYPFYGALTVAPAQPLSSALRPGTAVVSQDALTRLHVRVGDQIQAGGTNFRIAGVIVRETDRFSDVMALGVRCLLSQAGFARSGIARSGDAPRLRILFRLPPGEDPARLSGRLRELFPEADLVDFHDANRNAASILETTTLCLNLSAFVAVALGAVGMAVAARQHVQERAYTLAVMKMIGGRNRQLCSIFLLQIGWLAAIAFLLGLPLGWAARATVLSLAAKYVTLPPAGLWNWAAVRDTAAAGLVALVPALAGTALAVSRLKPAILLRKDFEAAPIPHSRAPMTLAWLGVCAVFAAVATPLLESWNLTAILIGSLAIGLLLAYAWVHALMAGARRFTQSRVFRNAPLLRHGIANLCRPGNRGQAFMLAMAFGLMGMMATFQMNRGVSQAVMEAVPFDHPDLVVLETEAGLHPLVRAFLEQQPGVERVQVSAQAWGRLVNRDGVRIASRVGCGAEKSAKGEAQATVAEDVARRFGLRVGSRLELDARDRKIPAVVSEVRRMTLIEEVWNSVRMDCSAVDPASLFYRFAARIRPDRVAAVRRAFVSNFPALPVFAADDLSDIVGQMSHDAVFLGRLVEWYALASNLAVLVAIVAASRGARLHEMAVLSALGARGGAVIKLYTIEFAAMGILAGAIGCVLGCGFTAVMVSAVLRGVHWTVEWRSLVAAILVVAGLSIGAGWLPLYGLLRRKPMEVLRGE
ncbi:MAG TPA: FtsX-like permease family protein [Bryobacteraceae bacterium]|nr:FtsX-like permease family protein [Bryobacteraceae bacterium]